MSIRGESAAFQRSNPNILAPIRTALDPQQNPFQTRVGELQAKLEGMQLQLAQYALMSPNKDRIDRALLKTEECSLLQLLELLTFFLENNNRAIFTDKTGELIPFRQYQLKRTLQIVSHHFEHSLPSQTTLDHATRDQLETFFAAFLRKALRSNNLEELLEYKNKLGLLMRRYPQELEDLQPYLHALEADIVALQEQPSVAESTTDNLREELLQLLENDPREFADVARSIQFLDHLHQAMDPLSKRQRTELILEIRKFISEKQWGDVRHDVLKRIFERNDSANLQIADLLNNRSDKLQLRQLPAILDDEVVFKIIALLIAKPDEYRYQLGVLLSQIPLQKIPQEFAQQLQPVLSDLEISLEPEHESPNGFWFLCDAAETNFEMALKHKAVMIVNEHLLLKFTGKLSALCTKTFTTANGAAFIEGNWYSPVSPTARKLLKEAFLKGEGQTIVEHSQWSLMRPLNSTPSKTQEILQKTKEWMQMRPENLPQKIAGLSRREYLEAHKEEER